VALIKEIKWMILGGDGQLGRAMAAELSRLGSQFVSLNHAQLDITNQKEIEWCVAKELPDVVVNTASWTNVDLAESKEGEAELVNAQGVKFLATECKAIKAKFVQVSTDYVFSGNATSPWRENASRSPISAYGRTKSAGEEFALGVYPEGAYIVRTAWLYSPWGKNFVRTMLKIALEDSKNVEVVTDQVGQPTLANDLALHIHKMFSLSARPGVYHGTNSGQASRFELVQKIFALVGADPKRIVAVDSSRFPSSAKRPGYSVLGHDRWLDEGLDPMRNWQDALEDALPAILKEINQGE
jgi:dTDP-4-dehydrorhamnose reductase